MVLNRRNLLVVGSGAGMAALLYGCSDTNQSNTQATTPADSAPADGEVALYDGSPIDPIDSQPINNPDGLRDRPIGGMNANVTVVEYVSPTCPFCAQFHATAYPRIKENYIDTGRVRYIVRPFRRNVLDLAVFLIAEASGTAYHDVLSAYLSTQQQWSAAANPRQAIFEIAQQFGFTQERFEEVLTDQEMFDALESMREQALNQFGLQGTPTFYINGQRLEQSATYESLSAAIDAQL